MNLSELETLTYDIRADVVKMINSAESGHPGSSLSMVELTALLFFRIMDFDPENPRWPQRDRFVLSKGHGVPTLYSVLARAGYFPVEELSDLRKYGSPLQGHPDYSRLPAVEASTGSLGQGLSIAAGITLAAEQLNEDFHTFCLLGDGELDEGQVWEAAAFSAHHDLGDLTAVVDYNKFQLDGSIEEILELEPLTEKWQSFGWQVREIDGHDLEAVDSAYRWSQKQPDTPRVIIAHTVKGKGVSFMENNNDFHGTAPDDKETEQALAELKQARQEVK